MSTDAFLPADYTVPKGDSSYLKFKTGENKFRILSKPIIGWEDWKDGKPIRFTMDKKPSAPIDPKQDIKHFWAMVVWDYVAKKISILQITQLGVQGSIKALASNEDWGDPFGYDITVTKTGSTKADTKYTVVPSPPKPVHPKITELLAATPINLQALFTNDDPFKAPSTPVSHRADGLPDEFDAVDEPESDIPF